MREQRVSVLGAGSWGSALAHLCLDKGYDGAPAEAVVTGAGDVPHIRRIGEGELDEQREKAHRARHWVVERTFAWLSRCCAIPVRCDKRAERYPALLKLASGLLWFRRWHTLSQNDLQKP